MNTLVDFFIDPYRNAEVTHIILELLAALFGVISVFYAKKENILVFPTGIISTGIYVYLLSQWSLYGDLVINIYYTLMSIYGWYIWTYKSDGEHETPITRTTLKEKKLSVLIFITTLIFVYAVYTYFEKWTSWTAYIDTITTAIFFVGMWLMAKRKIENWIYWIIGDIISTPLYFYKGFTFSSFQYLIFTFIAVFGYITWKKNLNKNLLT